MQGNKNIETEKQVMKNKKERQENILNHQDCLEWHILHMRKEISVKLTSIENFLKR